MYYRQALDINGQNPYPLPGQGSPSSVQSAADAILANSGNTQIYPASPVTHVLPTPRTTPELPEVVNTAFVETETGLMPWVKKNPLLAVAGAVGGFLLLKELFKGK